jgi:TPR repeat protein
LIGCLIAFFVVVAGLLMSPEVFAESLEDGYAAWNDGDYSTALREWQPLAEEGDVDAQSAVGFMYFNGQGVQQDYVQAAAWYRRAARQGNALAQNNLALMYANGNGIRRDDVRALMWFTLAAESMESDAARTQAAANRDRLAGQMNQPQIDQAQAMAWRCQQTKFKECD